MRVLDKRRRLVGLGALGALGVVAVVVLTACTPAAEPSTSPSPTPEASRPEPYAGPAVFVGDELESFLLMPEEIIGLVPEATEVGDASAVLEQVSDGGGASASPAICEAFYAEQSLGSAGARVIDWKVPTDPEYGFGRLLVLQFADETLAQARMDQLMRAAEQCAEFSKEGTATFDAVIPEDAENTRAFAGTLRDAALGWHSFDAFASTGNVIVQLWQPFSGDRTFDAESAAVLLQSRAEEARAALIDELTENPPVQEEDPAADPAAPWADWQIGVGGVGPLSLGSEIDDVIAAAEGAQVIGPEYEGGPTKLVNGEGTGSMLVQPVEGGTTVWKITVGDERIFDEGEQDGEVLPARTGVRVGALISEAMAAFPEGTIVDVASSGDDFYAVSTREGQVFRFHSDRDAVDGAATIIGITVEDGTAAKSAVFG